ncbi:MAG: HD-GYP domain-containing protein [Longimicrobiales bacterium]
MRSMYADAGSGETQEAAVLKHGGPVAAAPLADDIDTMQWILDEVRAERVLPVVEAEAIVASLFIEQRATGGLTVPLAKAGDARSYHAVHALNVSMLAMAMGDELQFDIAAIRRIGLASLLHDIGMMRVPPEVVGKQGQITPEEREQVKQHPVDGARILIAAGAQLDLAAVVAYEHHLKMDGSGYPRLHYPRSPHYVSRLVQVCDVYEALNSKRPYRPAWPTEIILSYLNERAGFEFHPALTGAFAALVQRGVITSI